MLDHFSRVVERSGGALGQPVFDPTGIGMLARGAERELDLAVQGEGFRDRVRAIGGVDRVADDLQAVRVGHLVAAPGAEILAVAVEHDDGRVAALEDIDAVLCVGRYPAYQSKGLAVGRFEEVADHLVGVFAGANLCHCRVPPGNLSRASPAPERSGAGNLLLWMWAAGPVPAAHLNTAVLLRRGGDWLP